MKRLFDEHRALLLHATNETIRNFSLPVSPRSEADLPEFLNSLEENVLVELSFSNTTADRLFALVKFCVAGISSRHKKVHKCAVSLLVQCISIASQDIDLFSRIRGIILALKTNVQSVLHRHLSTESQREQADMLNILYEHNESEGKSDVCFRINFFFIGIHVLRITEKFDHRDSVFVAKVYNLCCRFSITIL